MFQSLLYLSFLWCLLIVQFERAGSAKVDVLVSTIEPRRASQIVKELSALLPLDRSKVCSHLSYTLTVNMDIVYTAQSRGICRTLTYEWP